MLASAFSAVCSGVPVVVAGVAGESAGAACTSAIAEATIRAAGKSASRWVRFSGHLRFVQWHAAYRAAHLLDAGTRGQVPYEMPDAAVINAVMITETAKGADQPESWHC
jgi:hypothetical protein